MKIEKLIKEAIEIIEGEYPLHDPRIETALKLREFALPEARAIDWINEQETVIINPKYCSFSGSILDAEIWCGKIHTGKTLSEQIDERDER